MPFLFSDGLDDSPVFDRFETFGGGMDAFTRATLLAPDAFQYGENIIVSDNLRARTRPGADILGTARAATTVQGLFYFSTPTYSQVIAAGGGALSFWNGVAWTDMAGFALTDGGVLFEAAQGIDTVLITDGVQQMQSWDGAAFSGALGNTVNTTTSDPPVGATILCWHAGRMFASGQAAAPDTVWASFDLAFGTGKWDHTNFSFRVGGGEGDPIRSMFSLQNFNLAVLKANSVYLVVADPTAASAAGWTIQKLASGIGCVSRRAACAVGNDLLFMSRDGVRSIQRMAAAAGQYELSAPLSLPLQPYIDRINWAYASKIAAVNYKNLVFFAVPLDNAVSNNTVLVWNARLQRWVGVFTGWTPACWVVSRINEVLQLVLGDTAGKVKQWKDTSSAALDATYLDDGAGYASKLWSRSTLFGEPVNDKDGYHVEARFSMSNALVNVTLNGDLADLRTVQMDLRPAGPGLPFDLPFDLASTQATPSRMSLRGLSPFNECFVKVESTAGWWELQNISLSAFLNMLQNE
ncbi:MAG TPA: hypothetical protein VHA37_04565 [Candidatus Saccharimonadales bacterium]|nr:hypothetical protein [Candidatus Saccharimonadales bacterium]